MKAPDIIYTDGRNTYASAPVFSNIDGNVKYIRADLAEQPELPSDIDKAAEDSWAEYEYRESPRGLYSTCYVDGFKAGAEWQSEQYECIPTEESYMRGFAQGAKEERGELTPLINRLCEAILFEWKDAADLARKTLTQIKAMED